MRLFDLTGRVAIVTGSSRGIGRASAIALADHGARVVISSRKQGACDAVAAEINAAGGDERAIAVAASISDKAALRALVDATRAKWGRIDVLVCNAASNPYFGPLASISDEQFRLVLDNNILSNHWLIGMVAPEMRARREGSIVIVSSIGGLRGSPMIGAYNVSKAADFQLPQLCGGVRARQCAGELHRPRAHPHRFRARLVGGRGDRGRAQGRDPASAHRRTR